jgi:hypothetical protein
LLAEVVRNGDLVGLGGVVRVVGPVAGSRPVVDRRSVGGERPEFLGDGVRVPGLFRLSDDDLEVVADEVAEEDGSAGAPEHLDVGVVEPWQVVRLQLHGEQLRRDGVFVLRPGPGHPLAADLQRVRQRRGEVVGVPPAERRPEDEVGVRPRLRVRLPEVDVDGLQLGDPEVLGAVPEAAADAVGLRDVVLDADRSLDRVGCSHTPPIRPPPSSVLPLRSR